MNIIFSLVLLFYLWLLLLPLLFQWNNSISGNENQLFDLYQKKSIIINGIILLFLLASWKSRILDAIYDEKKLFDLMMILILFFKNQQLLY